jgi:bifunctional non-homologous end joining protein LigD
VLAKKHPASYCSFDLVHRDEADLCALPWQQRRTVLESLDLTDRSLGLGRPVPYTTDGEAMYRLTAELGYEGTRAKRVASRYRPAKRT